MTNQDTELFKLCKEVYERTGWDDTEKCYGYVKNPYIDVWGWEVFPLHEDNIDDVDEWHPLYTSDYLLEKLPNKSYCGRNNIGDGVAWSTGYDVDQVADTPLKALLKLVIALDDAGELK